MDILYSLTHFLYLVYFAIASKLVDWIVTIAVVIITSGARYTWSSFHKWLRERRERKVIVAQHEKLTQALKSQNVTVSGNRLIGRSKSKTSSSIDDGRVVIRSSKGHRGKCGFWQQKGTNKALIAMRNSLGLSRATAAEQLDVEEQELGRWERGECWPSREMLKHLCEGYRVSAEALGYGDLANFYASAKCRRKKLKASIYSREERNNIRSSVHTSIEKKHND